MPKRPFQAFLDEHRAAVLGFLRALVGPDEAEDCFQDTFMAALRAYDRFDSANPRAWIFAIARNKAMDHHRARARQPAPNGDLPDVAAPEAGRPDEVVWAAVRALPERQRAAVALRFVSDLRYREIAAAMGSTEEAARRNVHEALKKLRVALEELR